MIENKCKLKMFYICDYAVYLYSMKHKSFSVNWVEKIYIKENIPWLSVIKCAPIPCGWTWTVPTGKCCLVLINLNHQPNKSFPHFQFSKQISGTGFHRQTNISYYKKYSAH